MEKRYAWANRMTGEVTGRKTYATSGAAKSPMSETQSCKYAVVEVEVQLTAKGMFRTSAVTQQEFEGRLRNMIKDIERDAKSSLKFWGGMKKKAENPKTKRDKWGHHPKDRYNSCCKDVGGDYYDWLVNEWDDELGELYSWRDDPNTYAQLMYK